MCTPLLLLEEVTEEDNGVEGSFQLPPKLSVSAKKEKNTLVSPERKCKREFNLNTILALNLV